MDISIIIVNYNTKDLLEQCINSIYEYTTGLRFEIIVVDNNSSDGSQQMIISNFPAVILIPSEENLGFGRANNLGAEKACGKFLFLLNSDTILIDNSILKLKQYIETIDNQKVAVVGCRLIDIDKQPDVSYGHFPSLFQELFEYGFSRLFRKYYINKLSLSIIGNSDTVKEVDYVRGAAMLIPSLLFNEIRGFDRDFFLYYEETELCFRLKRMGYKIMWNPETSIIHYVSASSKSEKNFNYWAFKQYQRSKFIYYKKCHGNITALIVKVISIPKILILNRNHNFFKILAILITS